MDKNKRLGKILKLTVGLGGYQDAHLGVHTTLGGDGWGVGTSKAQWDPNMIPCSESTKWTEEERREGLADVMYYISDLLAKAKVDDISKLVGVPIEVTFEGQVLKSWRLLTEVI